MPTARPENNNADDGFRMPIHWHEIDSEVFQQACPTHENFVHGETMCFVCSGLSWCDEEHGRLIVVPNFCHQNPSRGFASPTTSSWIAVHLQCVSYCEGHGEFLDMNLFNDTDDDYCEACNEDRACCDYRRCDVEDWLENLYWDDEDECRYCDTHYHLVQSQRDAEDDEEDEYSRPTVIQSYSYRPTPIFRLVNSDNEVLTWSGRNSLYYAQPYLGFELETNCRADWNDKRRLNQEGAQYLLEQHESEYLYVKEDGSISGFEIVSHPTTVDAHRRLIKPEVLRTLANEYMQSSWTSVDGTGAGLHVHISKRAFAKPSHIQRFQMFHYVNSEIIKKFAGRDSRRWATFEKPESERLIDLSRGMSQYNRYSAMNFQNSATIELRYFRGSLQAHTLIGVLEFVHSVWKYTQIIHAKEVADGGCQWHRYRNWLADENSSLGYTNLLTLMDKRGV